MSKHKVTALIAVAGLAAGANARPGEAFLSLTWNDTGDDDGLVEPGESAIITVSSLQVWDGQGFEYVAFGGAIIDVTTPDANADVNGHTILNGLANIDPPGDTAEENGGNLENAAFLQLPFFGLVEDNPIGLVRFWVDFDDYTGRTVTYTTSLGDSSGFIGVIVRSRDGHLISEYYTGFNGSVGISIVPAPAGLALQGLCGLAVFRRRRKFPGLNHRLGHRDALSHPIHR